MFQSQKFSRTASVQPQYSKPQIATRVFLEGCSKNQKTHPAAGGAHFFLCFSPSVALLFSIFATPLVKYGYFCFMMRPARQLSFQTRFWHVKKASRSAPVGSGAPMVCQYCVSFGRCRSICSSDVPKWPQMAPDSESCALIAR